MIGRKRHLSWRELNRLADHELDADARRVATEHAAACPKCSRRLAFLASLREAGRDMRHPSPPRELLADILKSRSEGARVILPAAAPISGLRRRALPAATVAATLAGAVFVASFFLAGEAGAGASEVTIDPPAPVPGERIELTYRPNTELAGEPQLRLRLRVRGPDSQPPRGTLGEHHEVVLRPDGSGRYVGDFQLPPDFAYAGVSVEDLSGQRVDDRNGHLWGIRAHTGEGIPTLGSLRQQFMVLENRSWPDASDALHDMGVYYGELAEGWSRQLVHELPVQLSDEQAANLAKHREIFRQHQTGTDELSVEELAAMARYAGALKEDAGIWIARLEELDPAHRLVVTYRLSAIPSAAEGDAYLERLWSGAGAGKPAVYRNGFVMAEASGDVETARRWASRGLSFESDPIWLRDMSLALVASPGSREQGMAAIRGLMARLEEPAADVRPLHYTRAEAAARARLLHADLHVALAGQFLASGEPEAAISELERADSLAAWSPDLFRLRLEANLLAGDTLAAWGDFHRLDADPIYSRESVDSLNYRLPQLSPAELSTGRSRASEELIRRLITSQDTRRGLPEVDLLTSTEQPQSLASLITGYPTVLLIGDRRVSGLPDADEIARAESLLSAGSGRLVWVTPEPHSESLEVFWRGSGLRLPALHDPGSELATALGEWGSSGYYVIDGSGTIRGRSDSLMEAVRHLEVLLPGIS